MFQSFEPIGTGPAPAERLARLREALAARGVGGMLVPRADAHQGETIAPSEARLPWLTGFTGSAGLAVVLAERAAVFVDGRYTLQAAVQVNAEAFEIVATHETRPGDWLAKVLGEIGPCEIGFDPWLHGPDEIDRLAEALGPAGARLVPLVPNPIDTLWQDRPAAPMGAVEIHPEALAGESAEDKRLRLGAGLAEEDCAAAVLTLPDSIAWLLNIRGADLSHVPVALGFAILHAEGRVELFMAPDKLSGAVREHLGNAVAVAGPESFGPALDRLAGETVRVDGASCPLWVLDRLKAAGAKPDRGQDPCLLPKACKTPAELAGMRRAHLRDGAAMVRFLHWLETRAEAGATPGEIEIAEALEGMRAETGELRDISFDTICGSGPNGAIVHYRVNRETDRNLQPGELLLVDSGGQYRDGTTDITRTMAYGPVREDARRPYTLVLKGLIAISTARWPAGLTGRDLDPLARAALWRAGYDYDHGTGHGVGAYLNVHEGPVSLSRRSGKIPLEPGMVLSNEPGYYRAGAFGIRLENLVVVAPAAVPEGGEREMLGFSDLTLCPFDRRMILPGLLSGAEIAWLDGYHGRVAEALAPELPEDARGWLLGATRPLLA
ncbi:aminopeptidase P family protein [Paralimibaculum aggregatum]|uniref:Aminopeptidase P family protein n=1 Tax=Paralimibaculum aggregatum TaxID=3036245 RepID=A0ABQ6LPZ1_9RHOB|nr:aminopeptidase P family protein [Limibaculum sp. NKW23]GMG84669.1 aminopeptidase P family protein [Limibaculum sp. NKW23]